MTAINVPSPNHSDDVLVLGIGNPLMGDDGVGIRVAEMLSECNIPSGVRVEEAGLPGWGLPSWFEGHSKVILVDAVQMGREPGHWRRFRFDEIQVMMEASALSLHQPDLACGLELSQALDLLPQELILYGIQPAEVCVGVGLSPEVETCMPDIVKDILNDLKKAKK